MMYNTDFKTYHKQTSQALEKELMHFSREWHFSIQQHFPKLKEINQLFTTSFLGGKMLRGTLVKIGYELVQKQTSNAILKPAIAYEIVHASLLLHDDIIDKSPLRRGKPTIYHVLGNNHYGMSQTICLGDLGIILATKLIAESNFPDEVKSRALHFFSQTILDTILGETLDVLSSHTKEKNEKEVMIIHAMKTAQYTFVGPLALGALLGGASEALMKNITYFGKPLGIAFQLQDDILGIFGDEKTIGKSTTSDSEENKSTLLFTHSLKNGTKEQKEFLQKYYGKKGIHTTHLNKIKQIFIDTGALAYSQNKIKELITQSLAVIPQITNATHKQKLLKQLVNAVGKRKK